MRRALAVGRNGGIQRRSKRFLRILVWRLCLTFFSLLPAFAASTATDYVDENTYTGEWNQLHNLERWSLIVFSQHRQRIMNASFSRTRRLRRQPASFLRPSE